VTIKYRREIDGLRAVAVLPVMFFHGGVAGFDGGFVGVDVFFVISGYLITTIILEEIRRGHFSIASFYARRARRILPALTLVSLVSLWLAWLWMLPAELKSFSESLIGVATFTSNLYFLHTNDYFGDPAELQPLLHTWSLSVEEQFYIFYPLLLLALCRFFAGGTFGLILLGCTISLASALYFGAFWPDGNFYLLPTRAWELGAGALCALAPEAPRSRDMRIAQALSGTSVDAASPRDSGQGRHRLKLAVREILGVIGLLLIGAAVVGVDKSGTFPGFQALLPVSGAALLILFADSSTFVGRLLSISAFVGVGLVSYSAYLWHQPLLAFARIRALDGVSPMLLTAIYLLTILLAVVTWKFVETPIRVRRSGSNGRVLGLGVSASLLLVLSGIIGWITDGVSPRNSGVEAIASARGNFSPTRALCHAGPDNPISPDEACEFGAEAGSAPVLYIWADSHGVELAHALAERASGFRVKQLTATQCIATPGIGSDVESHCIEHNARVSNYLLTQADPGVVVLASRWPLYFVGHRVSLGNGCSESGGSAMRWVSPQGRGPRQVQLAGQVASSVKSLVEAGHRVAFMYAVPEPGCDVPVRLARQSMFQRHLDEGFSSNVHKARRDVVNSLLPMRAWDRVVIVDPTEVFCDQTEARCRYQVDGNILYFDDNHPSLFAASLLSELLLENLGRLGWLNTAADSPIRAHPAL